MGHNSAMEGSVNSSDIERQPYVVGSSHAYTADKDVSRRPGM